MPDGPPGARWRGMYRRAEGPGALPGNGGARPQAPHTRDYYVVEDCRAKPRFWLYREEPLQARDGNHAGSCTGCLREERAMTAYAELAVTANDLLASPAPGPHHGRDEVAAASELNLAAIGIADHNSFASVVRAFGEWRRRRSSCAGTRLVTSDGFEAIALPTDHCGLWPLCLC
mgnify:CR=1 FL=1